MSEEKRPAVSSLGLVLQAAEWMGEGPAPPRPKVLPRWQHVKPAASAVPPAPPAAVTSASPPEAPGPPPIEEPAAGAAEAPIDELAGAAAELALVTAREIPDAALEDLAILPSAAALPDDEPAVAILEPTPATSDAEVPTRVEGDQIEVELGDRRYVVRGLAKNTSHDIMKVNVKALRGEACHVDNLDLYSHRMRQLFQRVAADELELDENAVKRDLGRVLLVLERLRDEALKKQLAPKQAEVVEIPRERKLAALTRLKTKGLIPWIDESLSICGLVGERTNKVIAYLASVSRLLERPLAIIVQSSSAAGKSALMDAVLALMPEEHRVKYSAMTGQALYYMGESVDLRHRILAIAEEEGASRATYALKLLQSEGEISIISTGKDPQSGELRSKEYKVTGPVMIFLTTTAVEIDEELLNRCLVLVVDEGREQTRRIHEMQRQMMTLEGIVARRSRARVMELHQDVQRLLRPLAVRIPYAMRLTFADYAIRTRRDHMKYLGLIQAVTLLHQYQREVKAVETERGEKESYIDATPEDVALANELANEVLGRSLDELPAQTQLFLEQLHEMVTKGCAAQKVAREDYLLTRRAILDRTRLSMTRIRAHLQRLVDYEYVLAHRGKNGETFVYELLYNGEGRRRERFVLGLLDATQLNDGGTRTTTDLACLEGDLAPTLPTACLHLTPTLPGVPFPGNAMSPKGPGAFDARTPENAKGPKSNGDGRHTPPVLPGAVR